MKHSIDKLTITKSNLKKLLVASCEYGKKHAKLTDKNAFNQHANCIVDDLDVECWNNEYKKNNSEVEEDELLLKLKLLNLTNKS